MTHKTLPHRLRDGRCRDCSMIEVTSAPKTCTRCSLEIMERRGHRIVQAPIILFDVQCWELWRNAAADQHSGRLRADRFHLYVGVNDGGPLELAPEYQSNCRSTWTGAMDLAADLAAHYPEIWVVTTVGGWNTSKAD